MGEADRYVGLPELVRYSSLSERTLRRHMRDPEHPLPAHHLGARVLVQLSEFDAWLRERELRASPSTAADDAEKARIVAQIVRGAR